jgi:transcriptional regulator with XRE-family HTH domain
MYLHDNLKHLRRLKGRTCDDVAHAIGISRTRLSGWENAQSEPRCSHIVALAKYYRVTVDMLLCTDLATTPVSAIEEMQRRG